jgi:hypothetical protein
MMHAAAHGVSGGALAAANGGSFKDGFIGGAIGFGVGLPFGGAGGMIQGSGLGAIAARTAIAAVGGGVGSKLAGGSFADGAYSAAFFHLFNNELGTIRRAASKIATFANAKDLGKLPQMAAEYLGRDGTWTLADTPNGAALIAALKSQYELHGPIERWHHFGHGYTEGRGLAVFDGSGSASLYLDGFMPANTTADARWTSDIDPAWFAPNAVIRIHACMQGGVGKFAHQLALHIGRGATVYASSTGQSFYTSPGYTTPISNTFQYKRGGRLYMGPGSISKWEAYRGP